MNLFPIYPQIFCHVSDCQSLNTSITMIRVSSITELIMFIHLVSLSLFAIAMSEVCDGPVLPFEPDTGFLEMEVIAGFRVWQLAFMGAMAILVLIIVLCCFFRCRIPRTKQEIEADVARKKVTKRFRSHLEKLPVDKMELDKVLPEVIELEAKRLKKGEIEQKKTLFQKIKSIFFEDKDEDEEDEDNVSKATISFEEGTEVSKKKGDGEEDVEDEDDYEDETESSSEYDEHGEKIVKEKKKRRRKKIDENLKGLKGDNEDTSSEESKRIKRQYLQLSYKQGSTAEVKQSELKSHLEKKKNNTLDSVNITIEEEDENGVKPGDIESALERLRAEHMRKELQGKSSSTESTKSKIDPSAHFLPEKFGHDKKLSAVVSKTIAKQKTCAAIISHQAKGSGKSPTTSKASSPQSASTSRLALPVSHHVPMSTFKGPLVHAVSTPVSPSRPLIKQLSKCKPVPPPKPKSLTLLRSPQSSRESEGSPLSPTTKHAQLERQAELREVEGLKLSSDGSKQDAIYEEVGRKTKVLKKASKSSTTSTSTTSSSSVTKSCSCEHDHDEEDEDESEEDESEEEESEESVEEKRTKF